MGGGCDFSFRKVGIKGVIANLKPYLKNNATPK